VVKWKSSLRKFCRVAIIICFCPLRNVCVVDDHRYVTFVTVYGLSNDFNMTNTIGAGNIYPSGVHGFTPSFSEARVLGFFL